MGDKGDTKTDEQEQEQKLGNCKELVVTEMSGMADLQIHSMH